MNHDGLRDIPGTRIFPDHGITEVFLLICQLLCVCSRDEELLSLWQMFGFRLLRSVQTEALATAPLMYTQVAP